MKIRAIITGATGMVGEGVLHECLLSDDVEKVLIINRKPSGIQHAKLEEIVHSDFYNLTAIEERLSGYNACYFCLGVSSIGMDEQSYSKVTHDLTLNFAQTLLKKNSELTFCYVSGAGTDSTAKGKSMWARVKGKTENDLFNLPFKRSYAFRPGFIQPTPGLKNTLSLYKYVGWLIPVIKKIAPAQICSLQEIGRAMINMTLQQPDLKVANIKKIQRYGNA